MKLMLAVVIAGVLAAAVVYPRYSTAKAQSNSAQKPASDAAKAVVPPPIAVEVIAVDPKARTITVREIAAVPAPPGKPVEVKLPVPATATGQKLGDTKVGEKVAVTCAIKPEVHPQTGVPIVLTDCVRVIQIDPKQS